MAHYWGRGLLRPKASSESETVSQGEKFRGRCMDEMVVVVVRYIVGRVDRMVGWLSSTGYRDEWPSAMSPKSSS